MNDEWQNPSDPDEEIIYVSKSELKRDSQESQHLADKILNLSASNLAKIPLDDDVQAAVNVALKIKNKHGAYRRQVNFVGKLLRMRDVEDIQLALSKIENQHLVANQHFHKLEKLRDRIINEGDEAINRLLELHPDMERSKLRQLARQAKKEQTQNKAPKAARQIFQYLKEFIPETK
ncbi:ribosome biogenesis factor YjgA [Catenovulum sediminis]|uniref:Dual-action ribosomal maturation protein DarP n=1 Tax=Catenovulum sediminis TaxID=1740262 RepID=A0ABV1RHR7_9ALTE|nr:ribosome biogenesis factor YjgA [Catenovulum sediminis]